MQTTRSKPTLVMMTGLPGVGKTTLSLALGRKLGWPVLDKDTVKTALLEEEVSEQIAGPASYYIPLAFCHDLLVKQKLSIILDSPAAYPNVVRQAQDYVQAVNGSLKMIWCHASAQVRNQRLASRSRRLSQMQSDPISEEDGLRRFAHLPITTLKLDMNSPLQNLIAEALAYIRETALPTTPSA